MNKNQIKNLLDVIRAFNDGKQIQVKVGDEWKDVSEWHFCEELRIKPDERCVYKYDNKFVIMDVIIPLINDPPLFKGSLEECNKWIDEQVKEPTFTRDDVLTAEEVEENYTIEQNCGENRVEGGVLSVSGSVSEKKYRPFKDCSELVNHCGTKLIWIKHKEYRTENLITAFDNYDNSENRIGEPCVMIQDMWVTMKELFEHYTFSDGSTCGVEE